MIDIIDRVYVSNGFVYVEAESATDKVTRARRAPVMTHVEDERGQTRCVTVDEFVLSVRAMAAWAHEQVRAAIAEDDR